MPDPQPASDRAILRFRALIWCILAAITILTALVIVPSSYDVFRTPKDVAFLSLSLLLIAVAGGGALLRNDFARLIWIRSPIVMLALLASVWTGIVTLTSLRPEASLWKPLTVVSFAIFVIAVLLTAASRGLSALAMVMIPAGINAAIATGQSTGFWLPWPVDPNVPVNLRTTGLIGNPNELGTYLVLPALAACAVAITCPRRKLLYSLPVLLLIGIASAQSVTAFAATLAGLFAMAMTNASRRLRHAVLAATLLLVVVTGLHPASRTRFQILFNSASTGGLPEITSYRIVPAAAAMRMFLDRPVLGVGPGSFSAIYMTYKQRTDEAFPQWIRLKSGSFGEVHNDHLQILAEAGLPGYAIFVTALVLLSAITFRRGEPQDNRARFARTFAFPAAVGFAVLALAQFPLQLTAPTISSLFLATLCFAWTVPHEKG